VLPIGGAAWVALGLMLRLVAWAIVPAHRFASDEQAYFQSATLLLEQGGRDLFWPPVTGWFIGLARWVLHTDSLPVIRLAWIAMDVCCIAAVGVLAKRVGTAIANESPRARFIGAVAAAGYAIYLPAISHAQFTTSEVPALLQTLCILLLLTAPVPRTATAGVAGVLTGTLALTRPSLLPLLVCLPAVLLRHRGAVFVKGATTFVAVGASVVGIFVATNGVRAGAFTIAHNGAYNLLIGNRDLYAEDLNLFNPRATPAQVEFRRQMWNGTLTYPQGSPADWQREAVSLIVQHPLRFARRALGRLARVFVPRTDVLELVGGEPVSGLTSPRSLALLVTANIEWTVMLFGGIVGLMLIGRANREFGWLFGATIVGSVALCLIAISKPRYSFVFDPLLLIGGDVGFSGLELGGVGDLRRHVEVNSR
jgi:hypothetical protein